MACCSANGLEKAPSQASLIANPPLFKPPVHPFHSHPQPPPLPVAMSRSKVTTVNVSTAASSGAAAGNTAEKIANPFRMPSDEEVFAIRDDERRRREEERQHQLSLPAQEKGTWGSKAFAATGARRDAHAHCSCCMSHTNPVCYSRVREVHRLSCPGQSAHAQRQGHTDDTPPRQARPREHERIHREEEGDVPGRLHTRHYKSERNEVADSLLQVQMSLDTKRAEIRKLEEQAQQREDALKRSESM